MIVLKECIGKRKSHQSTVSPCPDKARLIGVDGHIASFLIKECLGTEMEIPRRLSVNWWSSDLFSPHLFLFIILPAERDRAFVVELHPVLVAVVLLVVVLMVVLMVVTGALPFSCLFRCPGPGPELELVRPHLNFPCR